MSQTDDNFINNKDYYIVEFPEERENAQTPMAVVPYTWLLIDIDNHVRCLWPQYMKSNSEMAKAVKNKIVVNSRDSQCRLCEINIKFKTNDYEKAISRLKTLENESSISSAHSSQEDSLGKRKTKRTTRYNSTDSESGLQYNSNNKNRLKHPITQSPVVSSDDEQIPSVPKLASVSDNTKILSGQKKDRFQGSQELSYSEMNNISSPSCEHLSTTVTPEPVYTFKDIFESVKRIETLARNISKKVEVLSQDVQYLTQIVNSSKESVPTKSEDALLQNLPLCSQEQMKEFEAGLQDDVKFSEVCSSLSVVGGRDGLDTVRRLLSRILSHDMALNMNWSGRNQKHSFREYQNIVKMLVAVVRKNPVAREMTATEVDAAIKVWLRSAPDRQGGRERRRKT